MTTNQDVDCGCTCNGYQLFRGLQRLAKPSVFVAALVGFALVLGAVQGFYSVHYQTNSINASLTIVDWLVMGSRIVQGLVVVPLAYAGGRRHRPVWLAALGGLLSVACFTYASFILTHNDTYPVTTTYSIKQDPSLCVRYSERVVSDEPNQDWLTLSAAYLVHLSLGLATTCFFAFALTYLDDNIDAVNSPGVIGIVLGLFQLGPLLGTMLAWLCSSTTVTGILWIVLGVLMLIISVIIGLFPRSLLDNEGGLAANNIYYTKSKGFFGSFLRVITNRIFLILTLGLALAFTAIWNWQELLSRYEQSVFYAAQANGFDDPWTTRQVVTLLRPVLAGLTIAVVGILMFRAEPTPSKVAVWVTAAFFFSAAIFFANIFLTCPNIHITTENNNRLELQMYCNKDCQCRSDLPFSPVYASHAKLVYFSPCHAGCTAVAFSGDERVYRNCSCVPTESVTAGLFDLGTCQLYGGVFEVLTALTTVLVASTVIGLLMLSFRVVLACDKPLMIALQLTLVTLLATIPGRQLFHIVARLSCIVSGSDVCRLHDAQPFVTYINLITILFLLLSVGVLVAATFMVRHVMLYGEDEAVRAPKKAAALVEMREAGGRGRGKQRRHSFHGEDQRLLEAARPAVIVQRAPSFSMLEQEQALSTYEGQVQKAASYSEELNKLLGTAAPTAPVGNTLQVPTQGVTVRREGMLTTLL